MDDQLEQLRALVMQSAKLHDVDAALERLHSLIALHGVTGALPRSAQAAARAPPHAPRLTRSALALSPYRSADDPCAPPLLTAHPPARPPPAHTRPRLASAVAKPPSRPLARSTPA